ILYLHSHDTGRYIQPYGYAIPTPNLQLFAEQGVLFRQAFCGGPTCSASRSVLLTGMCAHSAGMIGLAHRGFRLKDYNKHMCHTLRNAGYDTTLIGVQHLIRGKEREKLGYNNFVNTQGNSVKSIAPAAREYLNSEPEEPFFLSVGFSETHRKYPEPGPQEDARYCRPPAPVPDTPETRHDMASYKACARILDDGMGQVLDALDSSGLANKTLVICTTDHGIAFPGMKCNLTDHGTGIMFMMRGPKGFDGGKVVDSLISHVDIFPTICDYIGVDKPDWLQGKSIMPIIRGEKEEVNDEVFSEVTYHAAYEPKRSVRTRRFKYIRRFGNKNTPVLPNCDDSPSKKIWMENGWGERILAEEELYDLVFDPNETRNLANDINYAEILKEMQDRLEKWMKRTDDPLLNGFVPAPSGARVNDPDGFSPGEEPRMVE
ncbi:sulfatase-like hydrolase/transferase, partial [Candidatus Poribacteria bacterium]|nr:sulfatase-like hydrolase/transferase [Candidatus Poribacteria bacterium]